MASHSEEDSDQKGLFWSKGRKKSSRWHSDTLRTNFVKYSSNNNELTKSGKLLGSFLSKRRGSNSLPPSSTSRSPSTSSTAETDAAISRGVEILQSIFPKWEKDPLQSVLEANCLIMEEAISAILKMEEEDSPSKATSNGFSANAMQFPIKNPLPDDFLRVSFHFFFIFFIVIH
jgi:hypothetical protein